MFIAIYNGTTLVSRIHLYQDNYGLEQANSSSYQNIIISRNEFPYLFTEENFDTIRFISSELQEVVPEAVVGLKDAEVMQGVDYLKLLPIAIKAIQEQQCTICLQSLMMNNLKICLGIK